MKQEYKDLQYKCRIKKLIKIHCKWYNDNYFGKLLCSQGKKCKNKCLKIHICYLHICGHCEYKEKCKYLHTTNLQSIEDNFGSVICPYGYNCKYNKNCPCIHEKLSEYTYQSLIEMKNYYKKKNKSNNNNKNIKLNLFNIEYENEYEFNYRFNKMILNKTILKNQFNNNKCTNQSSLLTEVINKLNKLKKDQEEKKSDYNATYPTIIKNYKYERNLSSIANVKRDIEKNENKNELLINPDHIDTC